MKRKSSNRRNGFTIIELIITISILSFGVIGMYNAFSFTSVLTSNISARFTAAYLAQEAFEVVRNIRDDNFNNPPTPWSQGLLGCETGCQLDYKTGTDAEGPENQMKVYDPNDFLRLAPDGFYSYESGTSTNFKRKVTINQEPGIDTLKVTVLVTWEHASKPYSFQADGYLYNWK